MTSDDRFISQKEDVNDDTDVVSENTDISDHSDLTDSTGYSSDEELCCNEYYYWLLKNSSALSTNLIICDSDVLKSNQQMQEFKFYTKPREIWCF